MPKVFIGVGSNLGDRAGYLESARKEILSIKGIRDLRCSPVYETEPVAAEGGSFLNGVWSFETELTPREILQNLWAIETKAGRRRDKINSARTLDLDLLFYGDETIREKDLIVPHPRLHERGFVIAPFCDLAPDRVHPVLKENIATLKKRLGRILGIRKIKT
ncbi:MAG TPA: 2-amino-4-hydroxy-6-hydroxymethyldihydropteridine diphosphokinase [Candidatus Omnitrophota bacterium]|nr:2-amino-4-hydroxy-6-hydroxymethyldihydropteridine diphosphokinase [Candidatus Omnitrophota bacterium]HRY85084.1 2-amino-4-hydroxy-6-hydroxymethyldihydropteridine diphosphokinase [Candidatus Omnitrophota bacterium]